MLFYFSAVAQHHVPEQDKRTTKLDQQSTPYYYEYISQTEWHITKY